MNNPFSKKDALSVFLSYSVASSAFMQLVFTVNLIYFVTIAGLNPLQMVLVGTTLELAIFLFEVPTGVVADTISRRSSVIFGVMLIGSGFVVQALLSNFFWILLAQVLWGLGYTFTSGALQAWISDEIGEERAASAFLHATQLEQTGALVAVGVSGLLATLWQLQLPMLLGGVFFWLLGGYLVIYMPESGFSKPEHKNQNSMQSMISTMKLGFSMLKKRPLLVKILLVGFFFGLYSEGLDRLWVPHVLDRFQLPDQGQLIMVGWVAGVKSASMVMTFFTAAVVRRFFGEKTSPKKISNTILGMTVLLVSAIIIFAFSGNIWLTLFILVFISVLRDLVYPLYTAWVNHRLDSNSRATVLSMSSLVDAFGQISGGPVIGIIAHQVSIQIGLLFSALLLSPVLFFLKNNQIRDEE
jgi:DHA3 family tetracycline resistance protein-like MFS transporter